MKDTQAFQDKVVWVTGASSGYCEEMCKAFAKQGAKLILSSRNINKLNQLANQIPNSKVLQLDLEKPETFKEKTEQAIKLFGHIDIQFHGGAVGQNASVLDIDPKVARQIMEIDYFSYTELTQLLLPHFIARKSGHIVVISGLLERLPLPNRTSYIAAKAALIGYFNCLRTELLQTNINVTIIIPGAMQTALLSKAIKADGSFDADNPTISTNGCPLDEVSKQSIQAIIDKRYETYVGLEDESFMLWLLNRSDPELGMKLLYKKLSAAK